MNDKNSAPRKKLRNALLFNDLLCRYNGSVCGWLHQGIRCAARSAYMMISTEKTPFSALTVMVPS